MGFSNLLLIGGGTSKAIHEELCTDSAGGEAVKALSTPRWTALFLAAMETIATACIQACTNIYST